MRREHPAKDATLRKPHRYSVVLIALAAAVVGAGATWFFTHREPASPIAPAPSALVEAPPNVAGLPPAQAAMLLGNWHYDRQRWTQAVEQYDAAIRLGLDNADVRTDLGNCYRFLGQPQKALELYQSAQRQNPQHEQSLFNQAGLYAETLHDTTKAKAVAREFIARFPGSSGVESARRLIARPDGEGSGEKQRLVDFLNAKP